MKTRTACKSRSTDSSRDGAPQSSNVDPTGTGSASAQGPMLHNECHRSTAKGVCVRHVRDAIHGIRACDLKWLTLSSLCAGYASTLWPPAARYQVAHWMDWIAFTHGIGMMGKRAGSRMALNCCALVREQPRGRPTMR